MSDLYRDFIDQKADQIITDLGGTITPAPANAELYRDFLNRKFDDVINAIGNYRTPIKSFTYTGTGTQSHIINIPNDCRAIISIEGFFTPAGTYNYAKTVGTLLMKETGSQSRITGSLYQSSATSISSGCLYINHYDGYITVTSLSNANYAFNAANSEYTVYYI